MAALLLFEAAQLDVWVLEVGMGGRLDAVNVVDPDVAVVVSIGLDHQEYLGETLEAIAREKAGIFRKGVAAVLGSRDPAGLESVARTPSARRSSGSGIEYNYIAWRAGLALPRHALGSARLPRAGTARRHPIRQRGHRARRARGTAAALAIQRGGGGAGPAGVRLGGTLPVDRTARQGPAWILDVAHNRRCRGVLGAQSARHGDGGRTVCGVRHPRRQGCGGTLPRARAIASMLVVRVDRGQPRPSGVRLAEQVRAMVDAAGVAADSVAAACAAAAAQLQSGDRIVVFGSFHTVGPALDWLEARVAAASAIRAAARRKP